MIRSRSSHPPREAAARRRANDSFLTRSISFLYGFHGSLLLIVANDIRRYRGIVVYLVVMGLASGASMITVDLHAAMPLRWTLGEGPAIIIT